MQVLLATLAIGAAAAAAQAPRDADATTCTIGPITHSFGGRNWNVFSCSAPSMLLIVDPRPDIPDREPFFFFIFPTKDGREIGQGGTPVRFETKTASDEIKRLTSHDITALIAETRKH